MSSIENSRDSEGNLRKIRQSVCSQNAYPVQSTLSGCKGTCTITSRHAPGRRFPIHQGHQAYKPDTPLLVLLLCLMKSVKELFPYPLSRAAGRPVSGKASAKVHFLSEPAKLFAIFFQKISNFPKWRQNREEANTPIHYYNI